MRITARILLLASLLGLQQTVCAEDARQSVAAFNEGVRLFQQQQLADAARHFTQSARSLDTNLASRSRFNLGNTHYSLALSALEPRSDMPAEPTAQQRQEAIEHLRQATKHYLSSLRLNPSDNDARANIELAQQLIQQLESESEQSESEQSESEQSESEQSESEQSESEQSESEQSESEQSESEQSESQPSDSQSSESQQSESQQSKSQQSESQQSESESQQSESESQQSESGSQPSESKSDQPSSETSGSSQPTPSEAGTESQRDSSQQPPDPLPQGELSAINPQDGSGDQAAQSAARVSELSGMSEEEANKLLQSIRDREMIRRLRRQALMRSQRAPVDRDW